MMLGPIWPKLDLGLESDEDILEQFVAHTPELEQEIRLVFSDLSTIVREYEGSVDWIESLKARGYHTLLCLQSISVQQRLIDGRIRLCQMNRIGHDAAVHMRQERQFL